MANYSKKPTVYPASYFNASEDAEMLRAAMKGLGTDEDIIINILTTKSNAQRQEIAKYFSEVLERDLVEDLKGELGGHFEEVVTGLCLEPNVYLCRHLNKSMEGMGTEDLTLIEILCSRNANEIQELVETYENLYGRPLAEHMCSETSGDLRRLLTLIVTGARDKSNEMDRSRAREQAEELYASGEGKLGTEESVFGKILAHENYDQLQAIFDEYKDVSGNTIEQALKHELDGDYLEALLAIVESVQSTPNYFAKRLHEAMSGMGTDDATLIRIIINRSEIDLGNIKEEFERIYDKTLSSYLCGETTGNYKKALLALIN
ncbi:annexin B10 isoform X2 [Agrilus planipennis]|uniref:Annexin n=1 Tax=Agrilus planipennis TaxID=224129 RepID=A0A1W4WYS0_AGRPL|nr:annexin B10 isoform X2 [Agrilus planipennis]